MMKMKSSEIKVYIDQIFIGMKIALQPTKYVQVKNVYLRSYKLIIL